MGQLTAWPTPPAPGFPFAEVQGKKAGFFLRPFGSVLAVAATLNRLFFTPLLLAEQKSFDQVGANVTVAAAAGGVLRFGLYRADGANNRPGTLISDLGTVAADTIGTKTLNIAPAIGPLGAGVVWAALVAQVAGTPTAEGITGLAGLLQRAGAAGVSSGWILDGVAGALPPNAGNLLESSIQNSPSPALRMTS